MDADKVAAIAIALLAGSELLSYMPNVKSNGWVQLILAALQGIAAAEQQKKVRRR